MRLSFSCFKLPGSWYSAQQSWGTSSVGRCLSAPLGEGLPAAPAHTPSLTGWPVGLASACRLRPATRSGYTSVRPSPLGSLRQQDRPDGQVQPQPPESEPDTPENLARSGTSVGNTPSEVPPALLQPTCGAAGSSQTLGFLVQQTGRKFSRGQGLPA